MNHKVARRTRDYRTATALVVLAAVAGVLVASAVGSGNMAFAGKGISIPTDTKQKQECQTAGNVSLVTASCTALSTNVVTNAAGVLSEEK